MLYSLDCSGTGISHPLVSMNWAQARMDAPHVAMISVGNGHAASRRVRCAAVSAEKCRSGLVHITRTELAFANYATYFAASAANQCEVGPRDVTLDYAHDQSTLGVTG